MKQLVFGLLMASTLYAGPFDLDATNIKQSYARGIVKIDEFSSHTYVPGELRRFNGCTEIDINGALWKCKDKFKDGEREGKITHLNMRDDNDDGAVDVVYEERSYFVSRGNPNTNINSLNRFIYRSQMNEEQTKLYDELFKNFEKQLTGD